MWTPFTQLTAVWFAIGACGGAVFIPHPELPPVQLLGVSLVDGEVEYSRIVNSERIIRADFKGTIIDKVTERPVHACDSYGSANYGPDEPRVQRFPFDMTTGDGRPAFFNEGCAAALIPGRAYEIYAAVMPLGMEPDWILGEEFIWGQE